ncbi:DUF2244 domain-containing protein [Pseudomonadales bacterium]|nr:DUF2244 domain-containing protein [Pseudomonadales bacterium]MDB9916592.1 DUF2244 domain-containing protein [Pseudomonadales bacterium]MDB9942452.1 DUF2244 domain-containing protein [Pseudomonadales bacterium]
MVEVDINPASLTGRIVLAPNFSWTWRANLTLLYSLMAISVVIGGGFLLAGAWLILPFSILEISFLWLCIHYCVSRCYRQEIITISTHEVMIEKGIFHRQEVRNFNRSWSQFLVKSPRRRGDTSTICIRSHGQELEIGSFLNQDDKTRLVRQLHQVVYG